MPFRFDNETGGVLRWMIQDKVTLQGRAVNTFELILRLLSRDSQSSEQFAGLNRRYDEMQAEFALVPLPISDTSQEEVL